MSESAPPSPPIARSRIWLAGSILALAAIAAYHNSFSGPFVFDDGPSITDNPTIRHLANMAAVLSPPAGGYTVAGRPLVNLSLAINYALGGLDPWGYHAFNLGMHILAGLVLFGVVRRTLNAGGSLFLTGRSACGLGFAVALIWTVHPLQTEAVTYVIQRAESMMALFYLLTLYCFIRSVEPQQPQRIDSNSHSNSNFGSGSVPPWPGFARLSASFCFLGMATKEVMVSAPVIVLLYDRTFVSGTFREALRQRRRYYYALASSWLLMAWLVLGVGNRGHTAGANIGMSLAGYWLTQCHAIARYLRLVFWPHPLVLDYGTDLAPTAAAVLPYILVVGVLAVATAYCLAGGTRSPSAFAPRVDPTRSEIAFHPRAALGFAGAFFFAVLAPTSLVPVIVQVMAEHRMYLALAPVLAVVIVGAYRLFAALAAARRPGARPLGIFLGLCLAAAVALGAATERRNRDYRSELALWSKTAAQSPRNPRAVYNVGLALSADGRLREAIACYRTALRLKPDYAEAHNNLGIALTETGRWAEAVPEYRRAAELAPEAGRTRYNLGNAYLHLGRLADAIACYTAARRLSPENADIDFNLGLALEKSGRAPEAIAAYAEAVAIDPRFAKARRVLIRMLNDTGIELARQGRMNDAAARFRQAAEVGPDDVESRNNLGTALAALGDTAGARAELEAALRLAPGDAGIQANLARLPPSAIP